MQKIKKFIKTQVLRYYAKRFSKIMSENRHHHETILPQKILEEQYRFKKRLNFRKEDGSGKVVDLNHTLLLDADNVNGVLSESHHKLCNVPTIGTYAILMMAPHKCYTNQYIYLMIYGDDPLLYIVFSREKGKNPGLLYSKVGFFLNKNYVKLKNIPSFCLIEITFKNGKIIQRINGIKVFEDDFSGKYFDFYMGNEKSKDNPNRANSFRINYIDHYTNENL